MYENFRREFHCALTFEDKFDDVRMYRPVLRDLDSMNGTAVEYNGEGAALRRGFRWILGAHDVANEVEKIVIEILPRLKFQLVVIRHDTTSPAYIDKVKRFLQGTEDPATLFGG